jgi:hypothetical protein
MKKDVAVNPQSSSQVEKEKAPQPLEKARWLDDYHNIYTQKRHPVTGVFLERIAIDLIEWATTTNDIIFEKFFVDKGIDPSVPRDNKWAEKSPAFGRAYKLAKKLIGYKREEGGLRNKLNVPMVMRTQCRYDSRWLSEEKELAAIKASASDKSESTLKLKIVSDMVEGVVELEDKKHNAKSDGDSSCAEEEKND